MKKIYKNRINKLLNKIKKNNQEFCIFLKNSDIYYFTGFYSSSNDSLILISEQFLIFITDGRYINQFYKEVNGFELIEAKKYNIFITLNNYIKNTKFKNGLILYEDISYSNFLEISDKLKVKFEDGQDLINNIKQKKDKTEIQFINKAIEISEQSFIETLDYIKEGISEIEIKNFLENKMLKNGSIHPAFETIIASGKNNGALPHAIPTKRCIQKGDFITFDFGATYNHYCADITRTIALGYVSDKQMKIYNTVLQAKQIAEKYVKYNVKASEVHKKVNKFINDKGYKFMHSTGHGIGIDVHEFPSLGKNNNKKLKNNVIHTIEPGIYIPGEGGVRIEDDYLIKKEELKKLSNKITTDLIII